MSTFPYPRGLHPLRTVHCTSPPHSRDDYMTKQAPVVYDPDATCPLWLEFLKQVMEGDDDLQGYLQRALGYTLTGDISEAASFLMYGVGANGKSTFLDTARSLLGDYALHCDFSTWLQRRNEDGPRNDLALLAEAAGLEKRVSPHALRHTCATKTLKATGNLRIVQDNLGHSRLETTLIYTHVQDAERQVEAQALPRVDGEEATPAPDGRRAGHFCYQFCGDATEDECGGFSCRASTTGGTWERTAATFTKRSRL